MKRILIFKTENCWISRFDDPVIKAAFGTCDIPTPFTPTADSVTVISFLKKRNPDYEVRLAEPADLKEDVL